MREIIKRLKRENIKLYSDLILEFGLLRKRNECAICFTLIGIKDYDIQLCRECRRILLARQSKEVLEK